MTTIATHNAKFHTDDVFAVAALLILHPKAEVVRTRDVEIIGKADFVVDVGEINDPDSNRFDHHQKEGGGERENGVPYSSFGLVWKKFGEEIAGSKEASERIDVSIAQPIDGPDNGREIYSAAFAGVEPLMISRVINSYRPTFTEEENWDERFLQAVSWAKGFLERSIKVEKDSLSSERAILDSYKNSLDKRLVSIPGEFPMSRELVNKVLARFSEPVYAVYFRKDHSLWQVLSVTSEPGRYELRKSLPEEWRAKSNEELEKSTGVKGATFCHRRGFMCVSKTQDAALQLAHLALNS